MARKAASARCRTFGDRDSGLLGRRPYLAGEALAVRRLVGEHGEPPDAELDRPARSPLLAVSVSGAHMRNTTPPSPVSSSAVAHGNTRGSPAAAASGAAARALPLFFGPTTPMQPGSLRIAATASAARAGSRRSSRAMTLTDWPDAPTTCSTAASSGPATIASSVENGATTPMHNCAMPLSVAPATY